MDAEKLLAKQAETYRKMAESQVDATVGKIALHLLSRDKALSSEALVAEVEQRLAARAGGAPHDLERMLYEAALAALNRAAGRAA